MSLPRITSYKMPVALPENRVGWRPEVDRCALLIHDMQHHFLAAFDRSASPIPELLENIGTLADRCRALGVPVIYSAQPGGQSSEQRGLLQDFWGDGIAAGEEGQAIVPELTPHAGDVVLTKWRYSAFVRTELDEVLKARGRDQLLIVGIYGHIGCLMTACHAFMQEVQPFLVADAIADFSEADHAQAMRWAAARCAVVRTVAETLGDLTPAPAPASAPEPASAPATGSPAPASLPGAPLSRARVAGDVLATLDPAPAVLAGDDDLIDLGLDSIAVMGLLTTWREAGADVSFEDLAEVEPTLDSWWSVIEARLRAPVSA